MKHIATFAIAAVLVAASPVAVMAQDAAATTTTSTDAMTTGSIGNYGSLISSLNAGKMADLTTFTATSTVNCVKVSTLKADASADAKALDNALSKSATAVTDLKTAINANAELKAKLDATTCPVDDIVAVTTEADGSFTVYVDDRA
ncbi:hypothetical protein LJR016_005137 [Devosia sp. LjRoot16]|uniref:hypothetical protein n=1 Tax=unclassified Devosia TaxID=196773 RepID=UPI0006FD003A|nr:hypothetical protein [Devosia sp. Root105]KQU95131.1 hypothetical protein ASC68_18420 [Devosia sp. Root105]